MADQKISDDAIVTSLLAGDYFPAIRAGANVRISGDNLMLPALRKANNLSDVADAATARANLGLGSLVNTFHSRTGAVTLQSSDLNGLSGAGLVGISTGTGGISNTGSTSIDADTNEDAVGVVALRTRNLTRFQVNNDGTSQFVGKVGFGVAAPTAWSHYAPASAAKIKTVTTTQPSSAVWNECYSDNNVNSGDSQHDHVINWGWNNNNGAPAIAGLGAFFEQFESHYRPGGSGDAREWFEWHLNFVNYAAVTRRPLYIVGDKPTGEIATILTFTQMSWQDIAAADVVTVRADIKTIQLNLGTVIKAAQNNSPFLQQLNAAANAYYAIAYYDASDHLIFGEDDKQVIHRGKVYLGDFGDSPQGGYLEVKPEASNIVPLVVRGYGDPVTVDLVKVKNGYNADVFTIDYTGKVSMATLYLYDGSSKQVTFGANDSGGSGKKVLCIDN